MVLYKLVHNYMDLMMIDSTVHCGRSCQGCMMWTVTWCLISNFNIFGYLSEKLGCDSFRPIMFAFSDFIDNNSLVDLSLEGLLSPSLGNLRLYICEELTRHVCGLGGLLWECVSKGVPPPCYFLLLSAFGGSWWCS